MNEPWFAVCYVEVLVEVLCCVVLTEHSKLE